MKIKKNINIEGNDIVNVENKKSISKKSLIKNIIVLQIIIIIYSLTTVIAKFASSENFLSLKFIMFYGLEIIILGIYAVLWQQIIKKFEISIAYANRAMSLVWSIIWAIIFFGEVITFKNVLGIIIVIIGIIVVNNNE